MQSRSHCPSTTPRQPSSIALGTSERACRLRAGLVVLGERRDVLCVQTAPRTVTDHAGEPCVHEGQEALTVRGVLLQADAIALRDKRVPDDLGVRILARQGPERGLVGADRVGLAELQRTDT